MNEKQRQAVSELLDDALAPEAIDALLKEQEARDVWQRYHLVKNLMHDDAPEQIDLSLASKISQAISQEPTHHVEISSAEKVVPLHRRIPEYFKQAAGFAIAASVTAITIFGYQFALMDQQQDTTGVYVSPDVIPLSATPLLRTSVSSADDRRYKEMLHQHNRSASEQGVNGFMPLVKVYVYPSSKQNKRKDTDKEQQDKKQP